MATKKFQPLPDPLQYLQPFADSLAKLPRGSLNEDVDDSALIAALRERVRGAGENEAAGQLNSDRGILESWLKTTGGKEHVAYWILGVLAADDLASYLLNPPTQTRRPPVISIEVPPGWKSETGPGWLALKKRGMLVSVHVRTESSFKRSLLEREKTLSIRQSGVETKTRFSDFQSGRCSGRKFVWERVTPAPMKRIDYLLRVPGGHVSVIVSTKQTSFDETGIEGIFGTLRLSASSHQE